MKMEAIGRLAGGVAHDFNNLLMVVTGAAELIRRRLDEGSPHLPHLRMIQKATQDATDLTRQLLAFGRRQTLEPKVLDLNQVLTDMSEMLPRVIEESIEQRIRRDPALGRVKADPGQMRSGGHEPRRQCPRRHAAGRDPHPGDEQRARRRVLRPACIPAFGPAPTCA